eukprot:3969510-Amphidinium_carterae.1
MAELQSLLRGVWHWFAATICSGDAKPLANLPTQLLHDSTSQFYWPPHKPPTTATTCALLRT